MLKRNLLPIQADHLRAKSRKVEAEPGQFRIKRLNVERGRAADCTLVHIEAQRQIVVRHVIAGIADFGRSWITNTCLAYRWVDESIVQHCLERRIGSVYKGQIQVVQPVQADSIRICDLV